MQLSPRGMTRKTTLVFLVASLFISCTSPTAPTRDLAAAKALWAATAPSKYEIRVSRSCFCDPAFTRPVNVVVDGGAVSSARYADTGEPVPAAVALGVPTVDSLFAIIEHALANPDETVDASYDATFGFPVSVSLDAAQMALDGGALYWTSNFHPR